MIPETMTSVRVCVCLCVLFFKRKKREILKA